MNIRIVVALLLALSLAAAPALAQPKKDTVVLAMTLEPPGLDPTAGAASAIAEVVLYNIFETLTKINSDGTVSPLLAESWEVSPDLKTYTFKLRKGVKFQNGEPFNAAAVKFSFERAAAEKSTNKDKRTFASMERVGVVDDYTVVVINKELNPDGPGHRGHRRTQERRYQRHETGRHRPLQARQLETGRLRHAGQVAGLPQCGRHQDEQGNLPVHRRSRCPGCRAAVG